MSNKYNYLLGRNTCIKSSFAITPARTPVRNLNPQRWYLRTYISPKSSRDFAQLHLSDFMYRILFHCSRAANCTVEYRTILIAVALFPRTWRILAVEQRYEVRLGLNFENWSRLQVIRCRQTGPDSLGTGDTSPIFFLSLMAYQMYVQRYLLLISIHNMHVECIIVTTRRETAPA